MSELMLEDAVEVDELEIEKDREKLARAFLNDSVGAYLNDITKYHLLSRNETLEKFKKMQQGTMYKPLESNQEYAQVESRTPEAEKLRCELINCNLKFVVSIAKKYRKFGNFLDIIQEGNAGLMEAVDRFDYTRGSAFTTYAAWWIKQSILRSIPKANGHVHVPAYLIDEIRKIRKKYPNLEIEEACRKERINRKEIEIIKKALKAMRVHSTGYAGEELDPFNVHAQEREGPVDANIEREDFNRYIHEKVDKLDKKTKEIIIDRYGLKGRKEKTLKEIGERNSMKITRERVRQIESKGLEKLRRSVSYHKLYKQF